ncbi:Hypothetical protein CINCED_3A017129 [Cinara cedri]|uniref:Nuclear transport factor 2, eukaryote,NTF2-like domain n=1 Tax=Cinara cedri TaxID=506608 RepID=A0A5E4N560_9HEMI|nr:Hypothetical protein CINCED_3A017129 [Cinara cedri]
MADTITENAASIGYKYAEHYYAVLRTLPGCIDQFYDDFGEYQTVFENGTVVWARTRVEAKKALLRPISDSRLIVNSIITVPCGGSLDRLMVTVNGESFTQVFIVEYRPERPLTYIIVSSVTRHFSAGPVNDRQNLETRFIAGDCAASTGLPMAGVKTKGQVYYALNLVTYYETLSDNDPENKQSDFAAKILKHILPGIPPQDNQISQIPFPINNATNNLSHRILNHILLHIPPPEIEPSSLNIATGMVQPTLAENILQLEIVKPVPNHTEVSTFHEPLSDYKPENTQSHMAVKILKHRKPHVPPPDIRTSKELFYTNNATGNLQPNLAEIKLELEILKTCIQSGRSLKLPRTPYRYRPREHIIPHGRQNLTTHNAPCTSSRYPKLLRTFFYEER